MVDPRGFEPRLDGPKPPVLPLHQGSMVGPERVERPSSVPETEVIADIRGTSKLAEGAGFGPARLFRAYSGSSRAR